MKVWVADELGQIKSCTVENKAVEGCSLLSDTKTVSSSEDHDRSDYVQIMAHAKWEASGKSAVCVLCFLCMLIGVISLVLLSLGEADLCRY